MWNEPAIELLDRIPRLYETEGKLLRDKLIYLHFFIGGCDWYVAEYDGEDLFFGYAIIGNPYIRRMGIHLFHRAKANQNPTRHRG
jgi:hypothetical protein